VLFGIAAFAPWACFHFLHWAGAESATALQSATHRGATSMRHQTSRAQQAVQRATSAHESVGGPRLTGRTQSSNGVRRAADSSHGRTGSAPSSQSSGAAAGVGTAAQGGAASGGSAAGGTVAAVKTTYEVAKGAQNAGQQAGDATAQQVQQAQRSESPAPEQQPGSTTADRATRPDSSTRRGPGR
jgi:type IV secretion system protein TrbL